MPVLSSIAIASTLAVVAPPSTTSKGTVELPLRKLRLYETGVGYFERRGNVTPRGELHLPLPASHIDDALKSLVILESSGGVKIEGVQFDSSVSEGMARAMAGLPIEDEQPLTYDVVLASLKGSRVQLSTEDGRIRGRLVDLEGPFYLPSPRPPSSNSGDDSPHANGTTPQGEPHFTLIVLDEDDALRRVKTDQVSAIKVLDGQAAHRLDVAATALSDQSARQAAKLEVQVDHGGRLGLGYISESPVWRTTYRVVMDRKQVDGELQAWALVHNDTDENWKSVHIELANGRPSSFLHPLAAPRYAERELLEAPAGLGTVPQLANTTVDGLQGTAIGESFGVGGLGLVGRGAGGGGIGTGTIGLGSVGELGGVELGDLAELAQAAGSESGALFLYRVADPVDIEAHHSALLPIVQADIEVESITLFASAQTEGLSAARLVNTTSQTLPPGTVSFFADGGFVGEAVFDRLKPNERRFVPYGFELDVELERQRTDVGSTVTALRYVNDVVVESCLQESEIRYTIKNRSGGQRRVYVEVDLPRHAELTGDGEVELDYDLAKQAAMAATTVAAGATRNHTLQAKQLRTRKHGQVTVASLTALRDRPGVPEAQRLVLTTAIDHLDKAAAHERQVVDNASTIETVEGDLERIRRNLSALGDAGGRTPARLRLSQDLMDKEDQISALRTSTAAAEQSAERERAKSIKTLKQLNDWKP